MMETFADYVAWKPVVGYENRYEVSTLGSIRSLRYPTCIGAMVRRTPVVVHGYRTRRGYVRITLNDGSKEVTRNVAHIVLETFVGPRPDGCESAHLNGCPWDNRLANLAWVTHRENEAHKRVHGTTARGERGGMSKLKESDVCYIRERISAGVHGLALARELGVSNSTIHDVAHGKIWKHVNTPIARITNAGEHNGRARLNADQVAEIRNLPSSMSCRKIAALYGVCPETVRRIRIGSHWRGVA